MFGLSKDKTEIKIIVESLKKMFMPYEPVQNVDVNINGTKVRFNTSTMDPKTAA